MISRFHAERGAVTALCFLMAVIAWGTVFYGHSVYMDQLSKLHGWSSSLISGAIMIFWFSSLPGSLFVGTLVDKFGPPPVVMVGGLCVGGGLVGLSSVDAVWQLYGLYAVMGFGYPALAATTIGSTLAPIFSQRYGTALAIALTGASVGGALLPVLMVQSSLVRGFPATVLAVGIAVAVVGLLIALALLFVGRSIRKTQPPRGDDTFSFRALAGQLSFWQLATATAIGLGGQVGFLAHQVPIVASQFDSVTGSLTVTAVAFASVLGRLLVGYAAGYMTTTLLAAITYTLHGAGIAMLALSTSFNAVFLSCAFAGLTVGAVVMLPPLIVREIYGSQGFGRTYALMTVVLYIFAALAPWTVGVWRDHTGDYTVSLWILVGMELLAAGLLLGITQRRRRAA